MKRRAAMKAMCASGIAVSSGCLGPLGGRTGSGNGDFDPGTAEWAHDVGAGISAVSDELLIGGPPRQGGQGILALDVETGDRQWTYPLEGERTRYTFPVTLGDGIFFGDAGDESGRGGGVYALGFDGQERWTRAVSGVDTRPAVEDGVVFVGSDDGEVRALDAADGETTWERDVRAESTESDPHTTVLAAGDVVYVLVEETALVGLEKETGEERWRFGDPAGELEASALRDFNVEDTAYVGGDEVAAVSDGEALWTAEFDGKDVVFGYDSERVCVYNLRDGRNDLHVLDATTGDQLWAERDVHLQEWVVLKDYAVYIQGDRLRSFDADDGTERWSKSIRRGALHQSSLIVDDGGDDHTVFAASGEEETVYQITPDGEVVWSASFDADIYNVVVEEFVFVGTSEGVYAVDPR